MKQSMINFEILSAALPELSPFSKSCKSGVTCFVFITSLFAPFNFDLFLGTLGISSTRCKIVINVQGQLDGKMIRSIVRIIFEFFS